MLGFSHKLDRTKPSRRRRRGSGLEAELLEPRVLMYSTLGDMWSYGSRITYSLMPDGTNIAGMSSSLYKTMNAIAPTWEWQRSINLAALEWQRFANINMSQVSDNGMAVGAPGDQQGDPNVGDIRIGAAPLGSGTLAVTFLPPPANGGTDAGDIILNSQANWGIGTNYDLMTVVGHEFGHALGLGGSTVTSALMYETYNGTKDGLTTDDVAGIQAVWGPRQFDQFNQGGVRNFGYTEPTNINGYINSAGQITLPALSLTYPGDAEWFHVNAPSDTTGTMTVTVQSQNLSLLSPYLLIYNQNLTTAGSTWAENTYGATISYPVYNVTPGEGFYIRVISAPGVTSDGAYALQVNFGSQSQAPVPPPYTTVPSQPDGSGGTASWATVVTPTAVPAVGTNGYTAPLPEFHAIGNTSAWWIGMSSRASRGGQTSAISPQITTSGPSGPTPLFHAASTSPASTLITTLSTIAPTVSTTTKKAASTRSVVAATPPPAAPPISYGALDVIDHHRASAGRKGKGHPFDLFAKRFD